MQLHTHLPLLLITCGSATKPLARGFIILGSLIVLLLMGCAQTTVYPVEEYAGEKPLPKPERVLVYDFAVSPDEVELDKGLSSLLIDLVKGTPRTEEEREVGRQAARVLSEKLLAEIIALGLPAERATQQALAGGKTLLIKGQFVSINEGNRTERVVIGLGAGRTDVKTHVQVYEKTAQGSRLLDEFRTDAKSGRKPGMAELMGAGAAAGHLAVSAAVSSGLAFASEEFSVNVDADAKRTANEIAKKLKEFFARQGWIPPDATK